MCVLCRSWGVIAPNIDNIFYLQRRFQIVIKMLFPRLRYFPELVRNASSVCIVLKFPSPLENILNINPSIQKDLIVFHKL